MEEKRLSERESLELISQMIHSTRKNLEVGSGNQFLYWGYFTTALSVLLFLLVYYTGDSRWNFGWFTMFLFWGLHALGTASAGRGGDYLYRPCHYAGLESDRKSVCADGAYHVLADLLLWKSGFFTDASSFLALLRHRCFHYRCGYPQPSGDVVSAGGFLLCHLYADGLHHPPVFHGRLESVFRIVVSGDDGFARPLFEP